MQCKEWGDANSELFKEPHDEAVHKNSYKSKLYKLISASLIHLSVQIKGNRYSGIGCHRGAILLGRHEAPAVNRRYGGAVQGAVSGGAFHPGAGDGSVGGDCHSYHGSAGDAGPSG